MIITTVSETQVSQVSAYTQIFCAYILESLFSRLEWHHQENSCN